MRLCSFPASIGRAGIVLAQQHHAKDAIANVVIESLVKYLFEDASVNLMFQ